MGDPRGFMKHGAEQAQRRPVAERLGDWLDPAYRWDDPEG